MRRSVALSAFVLAFVASAPPAPAQADTPALDSPGVLSDVIGDFQTAGDYVHFSSTPPPTASAHGWWLNGSGPGTKAKVTVSLQVKDGGDNWKSVETSSKTIKPGGGSARRANARKTCAGTAKTTWRSVVDVDVIGVRDSPSKLYTPSRTYPCGAGL